MSPPPQAPGPIRRGIASTTANFSSRSRQADGSLVTSADLKSGPAASRNDCGSAQSARGAQGGGFVPAGAAAAKATGLRNNRGVRRGHGAGSAAA